MDLNSKSINLIGIKSFTDIPNDKSSFDTSDFLELYDDKHIKNTVNTVNTPDTIEEENVEEDDPIKQFIMSVNDIPKKNIPEVQISNPSINIQKEPSINNIGIKDYEFIIPEKKQENNEINILKSNNDIVKNYIYDDGDNENKENVINSKTYEEEIDDERIVLMDKIDEIKKILYKKNINIDNVPIISYKSPLQEIKYTYRLLQVKNNRDLNINFTNNMVKICTSLLEKIFDGKKSYLGITPNLVGYTKVAQMQLKDLNLEAEQISGEIFNRQSTSPALKIAAAIIPGMIYYSTSRPSLIQPESAVPEIDLNDAISEIKDI